MSEAAAKPAPLTIRPATDSDMAAVQAIYAHHVEHGLGSFEEVAPDLDEIVARRRGFLERNLPYLVAEEGGAVCGYAYAAPFRPRSAYRHTVEDSIYVAPSQNHRGVGSALLGELIEQCTVLGYRQMVAVIGDSGNRASIRLHEAQGFRHAGLMQAVGFKFGRWVDSVIMQRPLGPGATNLPVSR